MKKGNKKSKKTKKAITINSKNIKVVLAIVMIIIIILIIRLISSNKKQNESANLQMSDFEKIAVYNYIEDNYLDSNVLYYLSDNEHNYSSNNKLDYIIAYTMKKNNSKSASIDEVRKNYIKIYGEKSDNDVQNGGIDQEFSLTPSYNFELDEKTNSYTLNKNINNYNNDYTILKINSIEQKSNDENIIKIDILSPKGVDEFISYYMSQVEITDGNMQIVNKLEEFRMKDITNMNSESNKQTEELMSYLTKLVNDENKDYLTQKTATGELKIKINNGMYVPESFTTQEVQE